MLQDLGMEAPPSNRRFVAFTERTQQAKSNLKNYSEYKFALMKRREDELHWRAPAAKRRGEKDGSKPKHSVASSAARAKDGQAKDDDEPLFSPRPENWNHYLTSADQAEELQKNEEEKSVCLIDMIPDAPTNPDDELRGDQQLLMLQSYNPEVFSDNFVMDDAGMENTLHSNYLFQDNEEETMSGMPRRRGRLPGSPGKCTHVVRKAATIQSPYFRGAAACRDLTLTSQTEQQRPVTPKVQIKAPEIKNIGRERLSQRPSTSDGVLGRSGSSLLKWSMEYRIETDQTVRPHTKMDPFSKSTYTMRSIRTYNRPSNRLSQLNVGTNKRPPKKSNWGE
jgi:hypothetical protein